LINAVDEQPIRLEPNEILQVIAESKHGQDGNVDVNRDGSYSLRLPEGRYQVGMYMGPTWDGVNIGRPHTLPIEVRGDETVEFEIRLKPHDPNRFLPPQPLAPKASGELSERAAIAAINQLGGWVKQEWIDGQSRVIEVNMVYHEDEKLGRLDNRQFTDECCGYLAKFPYARTLILRGQQATDAGLSLLSSHPSLEEIYLFDAVSITDAGIASLSRLGKLRDLLVSGARLTDDALASISRSTKLESLAFTPNQQYDKQSFSDRGLESLGQNLKLKKLDLSNSNITDDGLRHVSLMRELEFLSIQSTVVTDAGLVHLESLPKLTQLWTTDSKITREGLERLGEKLPQLKLENTKN
jgi:hypothetical protein